MTPDASLVPDSLAPTLGLAGNPNFFFFGFCFLAQGSRRVSGLRFFFSLFSSFFIILLSSWALVLFFNSPFDFPGPEMCSQRSQASFSSFFDFFLLHRA